MDTGNRHLPVSSVSELEEQQAPSPPPEGKSNHTSLWPPCDLLVVLWSSCGAPPRDIEISVRRLLYQAPPTTHPTAHPPASLSHFAGLQVKSKVPFTLPRPFYPSICDGQHQSRYSIPRHRPAGAYRRVLLPACRGGTDDSNGHNGVFARPLSSYPSQPCLAAAPTSARRPQTQSPANRSAALEGEPGPSPAPTMPPSVTTLLGRCPVRVMSKPCGGRRNSWKVIC